MLVVAIALVVALLISVTYWRRWAWTGFTERTLWDWLQLLLVPAGIAIAVFALNAAQASRAHREEVKQAERQQRLARETAQDGILRDYLQQMSDLIVRDNLRRNPGRRAEPTLAEAPPLTDAQVLARTLTLVVLPQLDGTRKGVVLQFLWESGLITQVRQFDSEKGWSGPTEETQYPIISLNGADLSDVDVHEKDLAPFSAESDTETDPSGHRYIRTGMDLEGADLRRAVFRGAIITNTSFQEADVRDANFSEASLAATNFLQACLTGASFRKAYLAASETIPGAEIDFAEGRYINFAEANLDGADLRSSVLTDVNTRGTAVHGTQLPERWTATGNPAGRRFAPNRCRPITHP